MEAAAIVIVAVLLGIGLVASQLFRLRDWLRRPPPDAPDDTKDVSDTG